MFLSGGLDAQEDLASHCEVKLLQVLYIFQCH